MFSGAHIQILDNFEGNCCFETCGKQVSNSLSSWVCLCFLECSAILSLWQMHTLNFTNPFPSVLSHFFRLTGEWQRVHKPTAASSGAGISAPLQWWSCSDSSFIMENYFKQRKTSEAHFFPMFLPLSLQPLIRCLNLLQNNSAGKEIKGCWIKYEAKAVNCSNAYHFIQM